MEGTGKQFKAGGKTVTVYPCGNAGNPVIYLNTFGGEGGKVCQSLRGDGFSDFSLVAISGLNWDHDMSPWDAPPISKDDTPCTGGADDYLQLMINEIVPKAENLLPEPVSWRGLAGYSLAGLFALYSIYRTDCFLRFASMSGSLWFPEFEEYVLSHEMKCRPECVYFSLGDKEAETSNLYLKTVRKRTEAIHAFYTEMGIDTEYKLNPGNHYKDAVQRTAAGIAWILER